MMMRSGAKLLAALGLLLLALPCQAGIKVSVDGLVDRKGDYELEDHVTLRGLFCKSGISDIANREKIFVLRKTPRGLVCYRVNFHRLSYRSLDFILQDGDRVFVPDRDCFGHEKWPDYTDKSIPVDETTGDLNPKIAK